MNDRKVPDGPSETKLHDCACVHINHRSFLKTKEKKNRRIQWQRLGDERKKTTNDVHQNFNIWQVNEYLTKTNKT